MSAGAFIRVRYFSGTTTVGRVSVPADRSRLEEKKIKLRWRSTTCYKTKLPTKKKKKSTKGCNDSSNWEILKDALNIVNDQTRKVAKEKWFANFKVTAFPLRNYCLSFYYNLSLKKMALGLITF